MHRFAFCTRLALISAGVAFTAAVQAADIIVSTQDGKFVRVEGRATYPEPAPPDSLVVIDASQSPPAVKGLVEGLEHTVSGPRKRWPSRLTASSPS